MRNKKFKEGDLIRRDKGKVVYRFIGYGQYGRFGDMRVEQTETNVIYTMFSKRGNWCLVNQTNDLFPIY